MVIKATKKPVTIECIQWNGKNKEEIEQFCGKDCKFELDTHAYDAGVAPPRWNLYIHTLEGDLLFFNLQFFYSISQSLLSIYYFSCSHFSKVTKLL